MSRPVTISARRRWAWRAGTGIVLLAVAGALLAGPYQFLLGNVAGSTAEPARLAPCLPGEPVEIMDSPHISETEAESVGYNTLPPTSGPHYPFVAATGAYDRPIPTATATAGPPMMTAPELADQVSIIRRGARRAGLPSHKAGLVKHHQCLLVPVVGDHDPHWERVDRSLDGTDVTITWLGIPASESRASTAETNTTSVVRTSSRIAAPAGRYEAFTKADGHRRPYPHLSS